VWLDTVKRSDAAPVRGLGTLVRRTSCGFRPPDGRVEQRLALPGIVVRPETVLIVLSNPELQQATVDAEWKLRGPRRSWRT